MSPIDKNSSNYSEITSSSGKTSSSILETKKSENFSFLLKQIMKTNESNYSTTNIDLLQGLTSRVKTLSVDEKKYYENTRFGFIKNFFSSLYNFVFYGQFMNSGELGWKKSSEIQKDIDALSALKINQLD